MSNINENITENTTVDEVNTSEEITIDDIILACCGDDGNGHPKAGFSLEFGLYNPDTGDFDVKTTSVYCDPILNITRLGESVMIDFIYETKTNSDLRKMWALIQKYGRDVEKAFQNNDKNIPFLKIQIVPLGFSGRFSINAYAPLYWVLQPEHPAGEINMIRTAFNSESVLFAENEEYDETEIAAQLEREEMQKEFIEQQFEQRQEEDDAYREERQSRLEQLRRERQDY